MQEWIQRCFLICPPNAASCLFPSGYFFYLFFWVLCLSVSTLSRCGSSLWCTLIYWELMKWSGAFDQTQGHGKEGGREGMSGWMEGLEVDRRTSLLLVSQGHSSTLGLNKTKKKIIWSTGNTKNIFRLVVKRSNHNSLHCGSWYWVKKR